MALRIGPSVIEKAQVYGQVQHHPKAVGHLSLANVSSMPIRQADEATMVHQRDANPTCPNSNKAQADHLSGSVRILNSRIHCTVKGQTNIQKIQVCLCVCQPILVVHVCPSPMNPEQHGNHGEQQVF